MPKSMFHFAPETLPRHASAHKSAHLSFLALLLLAIIASAVYFNSLKNGFALDDIAIVQYNNHVINLDWNQIWADNYWPKQDGIAPDILYRPLTIWSYLATHALAPKIVPIIAVYSPSFGEASLFHLGNILLHALITVMVALLASRITNSRRIAFITGLIFALHPLHSEVVANVVGRAELLSTVFTLAALLVYFPKQPLLEESAPPKRSLFHGLLVAACFFLALLCKETPVALLAAFPIIDVWRYSNWKRQPPPAPPAPDPFTTDPAETPAPLPTKPYPSFIRWMFRQTYRYYLPLIAVFGIYLAMRVNACGMIRDPHGTSPLVNPLVNATPTERLITPFALFAKYLHLTFWPKTLVADYSFPSLLPFSNPLAALPLTGILLTVLALLATVKLWRRAPHIVLTLALFACSYAVVSNFIPIGTIMGERLFYLPSIFVILLVSTVACNAYAYLTQPRVPAQLQKLSPSEIPIGMPNNDAQALWTPTLLQRLLPPIAVSVVLALCAAMADRTYVRNTDWEDNTNLALATARDNPNSAKSCFWAGNILSAPDAPPQFKDFGQLLLRRSIELYPAYGEAYLQLARDQRLDNNIPASLYYLAQAAEYNAGKAEINASLQAVIPDLQSFPPDLYMPDLIACAKLHPNDPAAQLALAVGFLSLDDLNDADDLCTQALELDPRFHEAAYELGRIRLENHRPDLAIQLFMQYVAHVRSNPGIRFLLAHTLLDLDPVKNPGAYAKAEFFINDAANLAPDDPRVRALRLELAQKRAALAAAHSHLPTLTDARGGRE